MKSPGRFLGAFRLRALLAASPRAHTYLASAGGARRAPWVVKCLRAADGLPAADGLREDLADLASIHHPALALPVAFGRDPARGQAYFARRYLEGSELLAAARGKPVKEVLPWLLAAAAALAILHRFGFLHRNLKAANFLVTREGLSARRPGAAPVVLTDPAWWPEHEGESAATDLTALGALFYRVLTGKEIDPRGSESVPPPLFRPELPVDIERLVLKLLHPDAHKSYPEAALVVEDLRRLCGTRPAPAAAPPECFVDRKDELARVVTRLREVNRPAAIAVLGEAGIGKSSFLRRLALEAGLFGYDTVVVRCYPEGGSLRALVRALGGGWISASGGTRRLASRCRGLVEQALAPREGVEDGAAAPSPFLRSLVDLLADAATIRPALILIDEAHLADPLTVAFLAELTGAIAAAARNPAPRGRRPPSLAVAFRSESPFRQALEPLRGLFAGPSPGLLGIELGPLPPEAVREWVGRTLPKRHWGDEMGRGAPLHGHPFAIRQRLLLGRAEEAREPPPAGERASRAKAPRVLLASSHDRYLATLDVVARDALGMLAVLGRPARPDFLAAALPCPPAKLAAAMAALLQDGTLIKEGECVFFQHGSFQAWRYETLPGREKAALHARLAEILEGRGEPSPGEAAHHWVQSGCAAKGAATVLAAARLLGRTHEARRALALYDALLGLPAGGGREGRAIAGEAAEVYARTGEHRRGAEALKRILPRSPSGPERGALQARIGMLLHRAGDVAQAVRHLKRSLLFLQPAAGLDSLRLQLQVASELAEIASNRGDYARAEEISRQALKLPARAKRGGHGGALRREQMVLLETLAHLHLRRLDHARARALFERSLALSEEAGASSERCLILNNLGILHNQENRFGHALRAYEQAGELAARLGQDPILVNVHANLAMIHAKMGRPEAADLALDRAAEHDARCDSLRTRFLRLHGAGAVHLLLGRYPLAIVTLGEAIDLGLELRDLSMVAFDLLYLAECHLFRGESKLATTAIGRARGLGAAVPQPIACMAAARAALLAAWRGQAKEAASLADAARDGCGLPYLDAWNGIFVGWVYRLLGKADLAERELGRAAASFFRLEVPAGGIHATLELAAVEIDRGAAAAALERIRRLKERYPCGRGPLANPMLAARLLAYETRARLEVEAPDVREAAALLMEAEAFLIGHHLRDLESLVVQLKKRLERWSPAGGPGPEARDSSRDGAGETPAPFRSSSLLGRSSGLREVKALVRQVAPARIPVLISGETGTGKELVARAIHGESPRSSGPFVSINCASLPEELLEAELFGYRKGAFTGADEDRSGLLASAAPGTVFLDEVGETPLGLQAKLLRALDQGRVRPLGGTAEVEVDARFVFATNRDLRALVDERRFRSDLFFRLSAFEIRVPPLRSRLDDLPLLVNHFRGAAAAGREAPAFDESAFRALAAHPWPGNIRELQNVVTRLVLTQANRVSAADVHALLGRPAAEEGLFPPALLRRHALADLHAILDREYLVQLYVERGSDVRALAASLGIKVRALYKRFSTLGIRPRDLR